MQIVIAGIILAAFLIMQSSKYARFPFAHIIVSESSRYMIPSSLALAQVKQESNFNHQAVSNKGAYGLMQVTQPALHDVNAVLKTSYTMQDMFIPSINIKVGMKFLDMQRSKYNSLYAGYVAYYAGHYPNAEGKLYADSIYTKAKEY